MELKALVILAKLKKKVSNRMVRRRNISGQTDIDYRSVVRLDLTSRLS